MTKVVHIDFKFSHDLSLLQKLYEFNMELNDSKTKVITTTNTIDQYIKQVQVRIESDEQVNDYDNFSQVMNKLSDFDREYNIELMNVFVQEK